MRTGSISLAVGLVLAAAFALFSSGEPSAPPMNAAAYLIWFSVVMVVGAVNGVVVGSVVWWLRPRSAHQDGGSGGCRRTPPARSTDFGHGLIPDFW